MRSLIAVILLVSVQRFGTSEGCTASKNPCSDDGKEWIHDHKACEKAGCCWKDEKCYQSKEYKPFSEVRQKEIKFPKLITGAKFLEIARPEPPFCLPRKPFPHGCQLSEYDEPYVDEPPTNIPYCVRIPCSTSRDKQNLYEKSSYDCAVQPGCYFDVALFHYRRLFSASILPGVPVCHLAIRTPIMKEKAKAVIRLYDFWNPYFTNCLLTTFRREILAGPPGCKFIPLLKEFGVLPKLAGWKGINHEECAWIGACYIRKEGCFLPVHPIKLSSEPGHQYAFDRFTIPYGRPKCQHFNPSSPYTILKSYHNCLAAGCSVDSRISLKYYHYLFLLGNTMSAEDHWMYWEQVMKSFIGSHNFQDVPWKFNENVKLNAPPPPPPKRTKFNPLSFPRSGGEISLPPLPPPPPPKGKSRACGIPFRRYKYRPCPPEERDDLRYFKYCPYEPFHIPGYPRLTGRFDGCCDINPCYIPREDIPYAHSGPSHYYTEWSYFSPCSVTCGRGVKKRYRKCYSVRKDVCKKHVEEKESCNVECAQWGEWSRWGRCPLDNYCGQQERYRQCEPRGGKCKGQSSESRQCNPHICLKK